MKMVELQDYLRQKTKELSKSYENPQFWITAGQVGMILTLFQGKTDLFLLNGFLALGGYFAADFKKGKWRGDMREDYKKRAAEQTEVKNGSKTQQD